MSNLDRCLSRYKKSRLINNSVYLGGYIYKMDKFKYANKDIHIFTINDNIYLNFREIYKILKISNYQQYFKSISTEHTKLLSYSKVNKDVFDELNYNKKQSVYLVDLQWVLDNSLNVNSKFRSALIKAESLEDEVSKERAIVDVPEKAISELDTHLGKIFNYKSNDIRTVILNSELWFLANDITRILKYRNASDALYKHVEKDDLKSLSPKVYRDSLTTFWDNEYDYRNKSIINIAGLFSLIMGSQMEEAKDFKHWVTHEVLSSIYKTGSYIDPTLQEKQPKALVLENQKLKEKLSSLKNENLNLLRENNKIQGKYIEVLESGVSLQNKVNQKHLLINNYHLMQKVERFTLVSLLKFFLNYIMLVWVEIVCLNFLEIIKFLEVREVLSIINLLSNTRIGVILR